MKSKIPACWMLGVCTIILVLCYSTTTIEGRTSPSDADSFLQEDPTVAFYAQRKLQAEKAKLQSNWTDNSMWPMPAYVSNGYAGIAIDTQSFVIQATGGVTGNILDKAIGRYSEIFFPWTASSTKPTNPLPGLMITILNPYSETLELGTDESYNITVTSGNSPTATLTAFTVFGVLRGLETFSQIVQYNWRTYQYQVADYVIRDYPRFPYRGVMLDLARRFMTISSLKMVIQSMSYYKLNTLHLHLTDTDGWPIEIPGYPLLTQTGAYWPVQNNVYTVNQLKDLVNYGLERGVRIIPEIDTPGHSFTMCVSYPEYCATYIYQNKTYAGLYPDPSNPKTWKFLADIWTQVADIFVSDQFHIGSDEMWFGQWQESPAVLAFMKKMGYTNIVDVFYYYQRHMIDIMRSLGKKSMGWYPGLDSFPKNFNGSFDGYSDVAVNIWSGSGFPFEGWKSDAENLINNHLRFVVTSPYWVVDPIRDGKDNFMNSPSWQLMYGTDPFNFTGSDKLKMEYCLGGELTVWDDTAITDSGNVPMAITPHLGAVGEQWWSSVKNGTAPDYQRYTSQRCRTLVRGVPSNALSGSDLHPYRCVQEYEWPSTEYFL